MSVSHSRDPMVSFRAPQGTIDALDTLADAGGMSRSRALRMAVECAIDASGIVDAPEHGDLAAEIDELRDEHRRENRPLYLAGGFSGRVKEEFEKLFKGDYDPKWIKSIAEGYRDEARDLEAKIREHDRAPEIDDGELVEIVDEELRDTLDAADLSNWYDRHDNRYAKFSGVEDAQDRRRVYVLQVKNAMRTREEIAGLLSVPDDYDVRAGDLNEQIDDLLPHGVTRDDVAESANALAEHDVAIESVEDALRDYDPRGIDESPDDHLAADPGDQAPAVPASADGGTDQEQDDENDDDESDPEPDPIDTRAQLVERAAEIARKWAVDDDPAYPKSKNEARQRRAQEATRDEIESRIDTDNPTLNATNMDRTNLSPDDLIELANEHNERRDRALSDDLDGPINPVRAAASDSSRSARTDGGI